jgi:hypothetical protein
MGSVIRVSPVSMTGFGHGFLLYNMHIIEGNPSGSVLTLHKELREKRAEGCVQAVLRK